MTVSSDAEPSRLEKARLKAEQAKARYEALLAREKSGERKKDTRRKIILGGLLLDAASKDERFSNVVNALIKRISREHDLKAFEGWETPKP